MLTYATFALGQRTLTTPATNSILLRASQQSLSVFPSSLTAHYSMSKGVLFPNRTEFSLTSLACDDVGLDVLRCCHYIDMDGQRHTS